jgi:hypothetical protein
MGENFTDYLKHMTNMSSSVLTRRSRASFFRSDKTRTANVLNCFKNDRSSKFIGEVIFQKYVV